VDGIWGGRGEWVVSLPALLAGEGWEEDLELEFVLVGLIALLLVAYCLLYTPYFCLRRPII